MYLHACICLCVYVCVCVGVRGDHNSKVCLHHVYAALHAYQIELQRVAFVCVCVCMGVLSLSLSLSLSLFLSLFICNLSASPTPHLPASLPASLPPYLPASLLPRPSAHRSNQGLAEPGRVRIRRRAGPAGGGMPGTAVPADARWTPTRVRVDVSAGGPRSVVLCRVTTAAIV